MIFTVPLLLLSEAAAVAAGRRDPQNCERFNIFPRGFNDNILKKKLDGKVPVLTNPRLYVADEGKDEDWLPGRTMRVELIQKCERGECTTNRDGVLLDSIGRKSDGDWESDIANANHVFCVCPDQDPGYAICPYPTCDNCCQDYHDARKGL